MKSNVERKKNKVLMQYTSLALCMKNPIRIDKNRAFSDEICQDGVSEPLGANKILTKFLEVYE